MKYILLALPLVFALAACSKIDDGSQRGEAASGQATETRGEPAPDINTSVAPGVAFDFNYGFTLPERQIASVQESHARLCGKMGVTYCRVTAVHFDKRRGKPVTADMTFLLNSGSALGFARDATALVEKADGTLATSRVAGDDVGKSIIADAKSADGLRSELAKIDAELLIPGLSKEARGQLVAQSGELRAQLRTLGQERDTKVESLATTPVRFDYAAAPVGVGEAWQQGLGSGAISATATASLLAYLFAAFAPWAILGAGVWWGIHQLRRRKASIVDPRP
jgi:hypothetical protein